MKPTGDLEVIEFSRSDWIFLCSFGFSSFLQAVVFTIQGPYYEGLFTRNESVHVYHNGTNQMAAIDRTGSIQMIESETFDHPEDASATFFGLMLLYYHLLSFILTPIIGGYVEDIGMKQVYMFGICIAGLSPFLSAILSVVQNDPSFLFYSFLIHGIQAVGAVGMQVALYMMITVVFPAQVASVFALNQAMSILGLILGGPIAYFIGTMGGFAYRGRTFWTLGGIYVGFALILKAILPDLPPREKMSNTIKELLVRYLEFLRICPILLYAFSLVVVGIGATFLQSILTLYIANFHLGVFGAAVIPLLPVLLQLLSPLWGYILDKVRYADVISLTGACTVTISLILIGPTPFLPVQGGLGITCTGLVIFGLGQGALLVSSYVMMIQEAEEHLVPDDMVTMTIVSTVFVGAMSAGGAAGPILSGLIYDAYGFRYATVFPFFLYLILVLLFVVDGLINPKLPTSVEAVEEYAETQELHEVSPLLLNQKSH